MVYITNQSRYANFVVTVAIKANLMLVICNSAAACALTTACTLTDFQMYSHTHLLWATDAEAAITCLRHTRFHLLEKAGIARTILALESATASVVHESIFCIACIYVHRDICIFRIDMASVNQLQDQSVDEDGI